MRANRLMSSGGRGRIVVALSGGADSVALLAALTSLGYDCVAAHCNFHLRGEESMRDMRHAASVCSELGVDLSIKHFDVEARRKATGESVEMACRVLRYEWFESLLDQQKAVAVAVAHNHGDNVETFFLNLLRGTGIAGLTGIRPRNGHIIRPMLGCTREEILSYLSAKGLDYVTDSSNASDDYRRNRIRNRLLPLMEECFPGAADAISTSMRHLDAARRFYAQALEERRQRYFSDGVLRLAELVRNEPNAELMIFEWLRPYGFNAARAADILRAAGESGRVFESPTHRLVTTRSNAELYPVVAAVVDSDKDEWPADISKTMLRPAHIIVTRHKIGEFRPERNPYVMFADTSILDGSPEFTLRHWRRGDVLHPFGMEGSRKVSDIFTDAHLGIEAKKRVWLLWRGNRLLWVVGFRSSSFYPVTPSTREYLRLEWHPESSE